MVLSRATYLVSVGNNINSRWSPVASPTISCALQPMTSKVDKLPMDMEPVARDNSMIFTLKLGDQTFVPPYSTDNRSKNGKDNWKNLIEMTKRWLRPLNTL